MSKVCPSCGRPWMQGGKVCAYCGYEPEEIERAKLDEHTKPAQEKNKSLWIVIVSIAVAGLLVLLAIGAYEFTNEEIEHINIKEEYDDEEFLDWNEDMMDDIQRDFEMIGHYADALDFDSAERWFGYLKKDAQRYLREIKEFNIEDPTLQKLQDELELSLETALKSAEHGEKGCKYADADEIDLATDYIEETSNHIELATYYLEKYNEDQGR